MCNKWVMIIIFNVRAGKSVFVQAQLFMYENGSCYMLEPLNEADKRKISLHWCCEKSEHRMEAVVSDCVIAILSAKRDQTQRTTKSLYVRVICLCLLPLVVVTVGAVLFGIGVNPRSTSATGKNILTSVGMAVYLMGVIYFVIINMTDQSHEREDKDEVFARDTVDCTDTREIRRGTSVTLV